MRMQTLVPSGLLTETHWHSYVVKRYKGWNTLVGTRHRGASMPSLNLSLLVVSLPNPTHHGSGEKGHYETGMWSSQVVLDHLIQGIRHVR